MSAAPFKVKAVFEYTSAHDDDLSFPNGQIITVTEEEDADWYVGEYTDAQGGQHSGLFPKNFVERYEPEIPSRPTRPTRPKSQAQSPAVQQGAFEAADEEDAAPPPPAQSKPAATPAPKPAPAPIAVATSPRVAQDEAAKEEPKSPVMANDTPPKPKPGAAKGAPPPVAGKSNAFKDRIAAFNTGQGAAPMPFKPGGSSANYAVKKPFVAPPPSRNAYVPSPKAEPVHKTYRRDEDPEIAERIAEDQAAAESAGLAVSSQDMAPKDPDAQEDAPKPQSLKERIALLQKQQAEQAQRRADAATKEKPKRPAKTRRTESQEAPATGEEPAIDDTERSLPVRASTDSTDQARAAVMSPPIPPSPSITREAEIFSDGNEADQSAAGETTEAAEDTSDAEELQQTKTLPDTVKAARAPAAPVQEPDVGEEEDTTEGQSEEEEMDDETRRKIELRERMAKISGGMGMAGMFGPQPGMAIAPPARKPSKAKERRQSEETPAAAPPRPMIPVPGMMTSPRSEQPQPSIDVEDDDADEASEEEMARPPPPPAKETRKSLDGEHDPPTSVASRMY